jgi:hypothetical protein
VGHEPGGIVRMLIRTMHHWVRIRIVTGCRTVPMWVRAMPPFWARNA